MADKLRCAILIVSETAAQDSTTDKTIPVLTDALQSEGQQWMVSSTSIVTDSVLEVQRQVQAWTDGPDAVNLILTSGGTGFAIKDVTPEAVTPLLHRNASGLTHAMLAASLAITPFAMMSRPVAGVRNKTVIVTLPGSPKGAKENLEAILKLLPHACVQAAGANSRALHAGGVQKLERDAGIGGMPPADHKAKHAHSHDQHSCQPHSHGHSGVGHRVPVAHTRPEDRPPASNDPQAGPSQRHRESPYPMLSVDHALQLISEKTPKPTTVKIAVDQDLVGYVLAADVRAAEAVPAFRASIVDGYAVHIPEGGVFAKGSYPVSQVSHAKANDLLDLQPGTVARITTGAPLPRGASAVVMVEDTLVKARTQDGREETDVEILTSDLKDGENVREIGSDVEAGSVVLRKGAGVSVGELGLLASVGVREVQVYSKPVVGVLSTGDEIVEAGKPGGLKLGEVRDTNRPTLLHSVRSAGFEAVDFGIVSDAPGALEQALRRALERCTHVITSGGVSMGELDLLKPTIERNLGGAIHFGRVSMKPGKPTTFATVPAAKLGDVAGGSGMPDKVVFSLPGNPASAIVTFNVFVLPSLHAMSGVDPVGLPRVSVILEHDVRLDGARAEYHRCSVFARGEKLYAASTGGQRSSRVGSFSAANGLLCLPAGRESERDRFEKGEVCQALLTGSLIGGHSTRSDF